MNQKKLIYEINQLILDVTFILDDLSKIKTTLQDNLFNENQLQLPMDENNGTTEKKE